MGIRKQSWGQTRDGRSVDLYTLTNGFGLEAAISTYGGVVVRLTAPDRNNVLADITLGYDSVTEYEDDSCYFGCLVGRVANRIANAAIVLNGTEYGLDRNHGSHQLHGGALGFHTKVWEAVESEDTDRPSLVLACESADGEQGFPGRLSVRVRFTLADDGLRLDFSAASDAPTVVNMTNHSYFNLSGAEGVDCLGHVLTIPAGRFLETDRELIPTGRLLETAGTPLDFTRPAAIGERIDADFTPLDIGSGYDHCYVLEPADEALRLAASVHEPESGRGMEVWTDNPAVQFYSGNYIPNGLPGKGGTVYRKRAGFCLEAQEYVDAPNRAGFPSIELEPGDEYRRSILYKFYVR